MMQENSKNNMYDFLENAALLERKMLQIEVEQASDNIDLEVIKALKEKGYTFDKSCIQAGEGCTRKALYIYDKKGNSLIVKIPKINIKTSVYAQVNESKGNTNQNEYSFLKELNHKNLSKTIDSITMKNGNVVNIEKYLGDPVESNVSGDQFVKISKGIIDGVKYLNLKKKVLHRDIKPDNIIYGRNGEVTIIDMQNAKRIEDIVDNILPTRGQASYAHPKLLNAIIEGKKISASLRTEVYSVGAVMLNLLNPQGFNENFKYKIKEDENGIPIDVNGKKLKVNLYADDKKGVITQEEHDIRLKNALNSRAVMQKYKDIIYKAMTMNEDIAYKNIGELAEDFEKAKSKGTTFGEKAWAFFNGEDAVSYGYKKSEGQIYCEKIDRIANNQKNLMDKIENLARIACLPFAAILFAPIGLLDLGFAAYDKYEYQKHKIKNKYKSPQKKVRISCAQE